MRVFLSLLIAIFTLASTVRAQSITSFAPDTTNRAAHRHAPRDTTERPVWIGLQVSPVTGVASEVASSSAERAWDASGLPWLGISAAWPLSSPHQPWAALGFEEWKFALRPETVPFARPLLPFISPLTQIQLTGRVGIDQLIGRDRPVSAAVGVGVGFGVGSVSIPVSTHSETVGSIEVLVHALTYVRLHDTVRVGVGVSGGPTFRVYNSTGEWEHWELELRLEHASRDTGPIAPGP
jgi:hypothetical protein